VDAYSKKKHLLEFQSQHILRKGELIGKFREIYNKNEGEQHCKKIYITNSIDL
jgi:hypothetical protein